MPGAHSGRRCSLIRMLNSVSKSLMLSDPELSSGSDIRLPWPRRKYAGEWSTGGSISVAQVVLACVVARRCHTSATRHSGLSAPRSPNAGQLGASIVPLCRWTRLFFPFTEDHNDMNTAFVFDYSSVRRSDEDGHLFVGSSVISAAQVNPYQWPGNSRLRATRARP